MRCGGGRGTCACARPLRFVATWWPAAAGKETVGGPRRPCGVLLRGAPPGRHPPRAPRGSQVPRRRATLSGGYAQPPLCRRGPGGLSACPALRRPAGRGMGLPLGTPGPGPPAPRSPTRAAPGLTAPARHPAAHAGDSALPTTGTPSRVSRPGLAPPGPSCTYCPQLCDVRQVQTITAHTWTRHAVHACRHPGSGSAVQWAGLLPPRPGVCSSHTGRCGRSPGASRALRNLRASLQAGAALKRQLRPYSPRS